MIIIMHIQYTTGIIQSLQAFIYIYEHRLQCTWHFPLALLSPLASCSLLFPFAPFRPPFTYLEPALLWQDPSTLFPGCSWTNPPFPSPGSYTPHSKIPTPRSFPTPNIHSLGRHCEPSSQDRAQVWWSTFPANLHQQYTGVLYLPSG